MNDYTALFNAQNQALLVEEADFIANRQGQLSNAQIERIQGQLRSATVGIGCLSLMSLIPVFVLFMLVRDAYIRGVIIIGLGAWVGLFVQTVWKINKRRKLVVGDIQKGQVAELVGPLRKKTVSQRAGLYVGIGDRYFLVPKLIFDAAPADEPMAIYYLPATGDFLAMEPVGENEG